MAFVKKTWKDRIVQYANRRLLTKSGGEVEQVTVTRDEGTISEAGDQFNASNMNDLEQRVEDGFDDLNAEDLPIESGSATNTKDYIDSKVGNVYTKAEVNSLLSGLVKVEQYTVTTDAYGNAKIPDLTSNNSIVLSVATTSGRFPIGFALDTGDWYIKAISNTASVTSITNSTFTIFVWYIAIT